MSLEELKLKYTSEYGIDFDEKIIFITGELLENIGSELRIKFAILKQLRKLIAPDEEITEINLDISSGGGTIYAINATLDFYYELQKKGILVNARAQGICMSAATVLLAGATGERSAYPKCRFMLHDLQIGEINGTANQIQHITKNISDEQAEIFNYYALFSNRGKTLTDKELQKEAKRWQKIFTKDSAEHYVSSTIALELGLIDKII